MIIVNDFHQPLTIITKRSNVDLQFSPRLTSDLREQELLKAGLVTNFSSPENRTFENGSIVTFKKTFDIPLLNNLFISFLNQFISLSELKALLNNLFISYLTLFIYLI